MSAYSHVSTCLEFWRIRLPAGAQRVKYTREMGCCKGMEWEVRACVREYEVGTAWQLLRSQRRMWSCPLRMSQLLVIRLNMPWQCCAAHDQHSAVAGQLPVLNHHMHALFPCANRVHQLLARPQHQPNPSSSIASVLSESAAARCTATAACATPSSRVAPASM